MIWTPYDDEHRATDGPWTLAAYRLHGRARDPSWGWSVEHHGHERAYGYADSEQQARERAERVHAAYLALAVVVRECGGRGWG